MITRHILTIPGTGRRMHYRRCGRGPTLVMAHQSPRSSAEYIELMQTWGKHFTCIAPDTPGFGQSDPLPHKDGERPEIDAFADALGEFIEALGIAPTLAYGFHSGGIILVTALKRNPDLFRALAVGGYAIWTPEEMAIFGERYLPEFHPSPYGEHLTWLWHRVMEQSWFFPWFHTVDEARLPKANDDAQRVEDWVRDLLDSGNAYRDGYGAVLRAPRDIPSGATPVPPCLITAYDGDPLQKHIDRLGQMPAGWSAHKVATPAQHQADSLAFLLDHTEGGEAPELAQDADEGWMALDTGLIHWRGQPGASRLVLHPPAGEMAEPAEDEIVIDVPGHGQSDDFADIECAVRAAADLLGTTEIVWPEAPAGDPERLYPDMSPDRFGTHLLRAWSVARAEAAFSPWYLADIEHALPVDPDAFIPEALHQRTLARLRAGDAARRWDEVLRNKKR